MADWLRRAGHGTAADGAVVTWSVAEGRRGRRWREVIATGEGIRSSLLLELDPDGRFSHLELATAAGLLTLHPEGDGTLHGNRVVAEGVQHVVGLAWDPDGIVTVEGSSIALVAALQRMFGRDRGGEDRHGMQVGLDLSLTPVEWTRSRMSDAEARTRSGNAFAEAGLPDLPGGSSWPLEID